MAKAPPKAPQDELWQRAAGSKPKTPPKVVKDQLWERGPGTKNNTPKPKVKQTAPKQPPKSLFGAQSSVNRQANLHSLSAKQVQTLLAAKGYKVPTSGKMDAQTKTAIDAYVSNKPPKQYNTWAAKVYAPKAAPPHSLFGAQTGKLAPTPAAPAGKKQTGPKGGLGVDLANLNDIGTSIGVDTPESFADVIANGTAGQAVTDAQRQIDRAPAQNAQNTHDIGHWYDQVLASQATAAGRDAEIGAAGTNSIRDAVKSVVASLGGAANEGSGMVAAEGQRGADMLQALSANEDQYNADVRPLMQAESAGANTRELTRQSNDMKDLQNKLTDAKTAKGAARIDALMKIRSDNNALAQQRFTNQLNLSNAKEAALMNGLKIAGGGASATSPNTLAKASNGAMNQFIAYDDQGNQMPGYSTKGKNPQQVVQMVNNAYLGMGLNLKDPRVAQSAMATLRGLGIQPDPHWYGQG
jgi:hypothetical protein